MNEKRVSPQSVLLIRCIWFHVPPSALPLMAVETPFSEVSEVLK